MRIRVLIPLLIAAVAGSSLFAPATAHAQNRSRGRVPAGLGGGREARAREDAREREIVARRTAERRAQVRANGRIFRDIAVDRQFGGEYVVARDQDVTAFLDVTDPQHPAFDPARESDEEELERIPLSRRAHILVVPNQPREHLTGTLGASITEGDMESSLKVMRSARAIAQRLGIQNPRIFISPESRVAVGYLHVHIIGERPPGRSYPAPL